jgi:3-hydroxyisobutyrate dehydrogenase-like beta-hydroxyacid dehydrogenase
MAANLLAKGFALTTCPHRNMQPIERLKAQGASVAATPREVAAASEVVVVCVPDAPQVEEACLGEQGIIHGAAPGTIVIDCSTISPTVSQQVAAALGERDISMIDAPISGGPERAATGELAIMVGGEPDVFARAKPVLDAMGRSITHVGPNGMGEVVKLANNAIIGSLMIAMSETLTMAVKAGGDINVIRDVIMQSSGANFILDKWIAERALKDNYDPGFATELMQKDVGAALEAGKALGVPMMLTALSYQLYELAEGMGYAREDYCSISKIYQDAANVTIATGEPRKKA